MSRRIIWPTLLIIATFAITGCSPQGDLGKRYDVSIDYYNNSHRYWELYFNGSKEDAKRAIEWHESTLVEIENDLHDGFPFDRERFFIALRAMDLYCHLGNADTCNKYTEISIGYGQTAFPDLFINTTDLRSVLNLALKELNQDLNPAWKRN